MVGQMFWTVMVKDLEDERLHRGKKGDFKRQGGRRPPSDLVQWVAAS